jgi:hypothetical protein
MTTIYRIVWQKDEALPDRGGYVEFLDLVEAEKFRDEHYPSGQIEIIERDLTPTPLEIESEELL